MLKPKKTPGFTHLNTALNTNCNTSRSKDHKTHLSLTNSDYKSTLNKKSSSPTMKDLLNYQS